MEKMQKFGRNSRRFIKRLSDRGAEKQDDENLNFCTKIHKEERSIIWKIENFDRCPLKLGEYHQSPQFCTGYSSDTVWTLRIYPKGKTNSGKVGFYLCKVSPNTNVSVEIQLDVAVPAIDNVFRVLEKKISRMDSDELGADVNIPSAEFLRQQSVKMVCTLTVGYLDEIDDGSCSGAYLPLFLSSAMKVMFTVLYLTIGINGLSLSMRPCAQDNRPFTMDEVEGIVYTLAREKGVAPTVILNRLLRKVRIRQRTEKVKPKLPLQDIALQELINSESLPRRPPISVDTGGRMMPDRQPTVSQSLLPPPINPDGSALIGEGIHPARLPPPGVTVQTLPTFPRQQAGYVMTGMFLPPGFPPQLSRPIPQSLFIPIPSLNPPPGVTIRVKAGISGNAFPEVTVTLSPMMTIVEALKQAESKFRSALGLSPVSDAEVISFSRSSFDECYVIRSFDSIESSERGFWKILVSDISGKVIYDSVCLPSRSEVPVKPGMTITLLYTVV